MKWLCLLRVGLLGYSEGHKWAETFTPNSQSATAMQLCIRCGENGWTI